jgi:hypothetical protein
MTDDPDPRGLIAEAYRVPGIREAECRSVFLGWVLGLPEGADVPALARELLARPESAPGHPMTVVLQNATLAAGQPRRRGGRSRVSGAAPPPPPPER